MYFLASIFDIGVSITQAIRSFGGLIASTIYNFIISIYNIFEILARADFLDSSFANQVYTKAGLILGLFMVFKLSFVLVQSLISPEKLNDKKNGVGNIILRIIISIVLLGITPTIFKEAFRLQNLLIGTNNSDNIVYKLIVGQNISNKENFGTELAKNIFFEFYSDERSPKYNGGITMSSSIQTSTDGTVDTGTYIKANNFDSIVDDVSRNESFSSTPYYLALTDAYGDYYIEFDFLGSCIVGIVIAWILLSFCIQIGIRVFKLAFLQLIAPIPILSYVSDPEGSFKKWIQQCGTTFIDLFIRLMIIYFVIFFSKDILNQVDNGIGYLRNNSDSTWVKVFLIIGLLMFAKRVPELLKEIFPSGGKFDLGIKSPKKLLGEIPGGKAAWGLGTGVAIGAAAGLGSNAVHGFMNMKKAWKDNKGFKKVTGSLGAGTKGIFSMAGGALGGAKIGGTTGFKGKKMPGVKATVQQSNENREKRELKHVAGYHWYNVPPDKVLAFAGETTGAEKKIKAAEFRIDALQQSKTIQWQNFAQANPTADLSLLRSLQEFEEHGKKIWKGIDSTGKERTFTATRNANGQITAFTSIGGGPNISATETSMVNTSANIDKQIKNQKKIIKGLQTAANEAKK